MTPDRKRLAKLERAARTAARRLDALLAEREVLASERLYHKIRLTRARLYAVLDNEARTP